MRPNELEVWVLGILDRVRKGQGIEDSRIELKRDLPEPVKAARQLGGHANAAAGGSILWVIGVDENGKIVGVDHTEVTVWWAKIGSRFDMLAPQLIMDLQVPFQEVTVSALLFDTTRAPYVIKNPIGGSPYEVPWREGTGTRTANRADLLRILSPLQTLPDIEVISGTATAMIRGRKPPFKLEWRLQISLYITPASDTKLVLPFHRCRLEFFLEHQKRFRVEQIVLTPKVSTEEIDREALSFPRGFEVPSHTVTAQVTRTELILEGPSRIVCLAETTTEPAEDIHVPLHLTLSIGAARSTNPVVCDVEMLPFSSGDANEYNWALMNPKYFQDSRTDT